MHHPVQMDIVLFHKFTQHKDLRRELLSTRNAELIEVRTTRGVLVFSSRTYMPPQNSDKDSFWGCGADGNGRNELGKALERLRKKLREEDRR